MFMVINKDKVISYLISLSTVAMLFLFSFMISKKNDEVIRTSANTMRENYYEQTNSTNKNDTEIIDDDNNLD